MAESSKDDTPDPRDTALRECITALRAVQPLLALPRDRKQLEDVALRAEQALINHELGLA